MKREQVGKKSNLGKERKAVNNSSFALKVHARRLPELWSTPAIISSFFKNHSLSADCRHERSYLTIHDERPPRCNKESFMDSYL